MSLEDVEKIMDDTQDAIEYQKVWEFRFLLGVTLLFVANRRAPRTESVARRRRRSAERTGSIAWGETDITCICDMHTSFIYVKVPEPGLKLPEVPDHEIATPIGDRLPEVPDTEISESKRYNKKCQLPNFSLITEKRKETAEPLTA